MDLDGIGYARDIWEERAKVLANVPASHRARILGLPRPYAEPKKHEITVDLRTGKRTVSTAPIPAPPKPAPQPPRPPVVRRIVVEYPKMPDGPSPETIISAILTATGISQYEYLREGRSSAKIGNARMMGYWLTKQIHPQISLHEMGRMFRKDHTTILSGVRKGEARKDTAPISEWLSHPAIVALLEKGGRP